MLVVLLPDLLEPNYVRRRQTTGVLAKDRLKGFSKIARRNTAEIKRGDQSIDAWYAPHVGRQDSAGESLSLSAVMHAGLADAYLSDSCDQVPLRARTVANDETVTIGMAQIPTFINVFINFVLYGCLKHLLCSLPKDPFKTQLSILNKLLRRLFRYIFLHERILSPCANRVLGLRLPERIRFFLPSTTFGYISSRVSLPLSLKVNQNLAEERQWSKDCESREITCSSAQWSSPRFVDIWMG
jgi:hypothetical protein